LRESERPGLVKGTPSGVPRTEYFSSVSGLGLVEPELLQSLSESRAVDPEDLRGLRDLPAALPESLLDREALRLVHELLGLGDSAHGGPHVLGPHRPFGTDGALADLVLELPDVAAPLCALDGAKRFGREGEGPSPLLLLLQELLREEDGVARSFAEWREDEVED